MGEEEVEEESSPLELMDQSIIPGLPDDLAIKCLTKISHGYHGVLETVSKKWRDVLHSSDYSCVKASEGSCGNWLFILTEGDNSEWIAYDPEANRWHPLPKIPRLNNSWNHFGFSCVCVCKRFFVIGGSYEPRNPFSKGPHQKPLVTNDVMVFDPFTKQWSKAASMESTRSHFACSVVRGKVYVAGGRTASGSKGLRLAEVYDPLEDRWEDLPPMPMPLMYCIGLTYNDKLLVLSEFIGSPISPTSELYDPSDGKWCTVKDIRPLSRAMQLTVTVAGNNRVYVVFDCGESSIKTRDNDQDEWRILGSIPPVLLPDHSRPLEAFGSGFASLGEDFYVLGGKVLKWDESGAGRFDILKLKTARACNSSNLPLKWREIRPMCRFAKGAVIGCATLEE